MNLFMGRRKILSGACVCSNQSKGCSLPVKTMSIILKLNIIIVMCRAVLGVNWIKNTHCVNSCSKLHTPRINIVAYLCYSSVIIYRLQKR